MLWCKESFEQHFKPSECRLFALQRQLFDFVDSTAAAATQDAACEDAWLCFSIEFPSASEVSRLLSRHTASSRAASPLFRSTLPAAPCDSTPVGGKRPRDDYSLLYGAEPLSQQTRMFLAATPAGLQEMLATIDSRQLHLYEIIREGTPCHLYFDVEREGNHVALRDVVCVEEDSNTSSVIADDSLVCVEEEETDNGGCSRRVVFQCTATHYQALRGRVSTTPPEMCGLDCPVEPQNTDTCEVLLSQLEAFVRCEFPSLVPPQCRHDSSASVFREVVVLQSVPLSGTQAKFSQHYVLKFHGHAFQSTNSAKEFVRQFVSHLSRRAAAHDTQLHRSLFFHGPPVWCAVFHELSDDYPRNTLPYLPRRCVIDEAVYSKNRMMRCVGSCKLGKASVLRLHRHFIREQCQPSSCPTGEAPPSLSLFLDTLITCRGGSDEAVQLVHVAGEAAVGEKPAAKRALPHTTHPESGDARWAVAGLDDGLTRGIASSLEQAYSRIAQKPCTVQRPRQSQGRFLTFQVLGTRYCQHVRREHKSNNVYLVVDVERRVFVQKCFDPDCASFRSAPHPLDFA